MNAALPVVGLIVGCGVLGLLVGSFLNAWAYRLPRWISVARGRSVCPACDELIAWYDNLPLVSYFLLHGRCRACGAHISLRYPLGEAATAALFAGAAAFTGFRWVLLPQLVFLAVLAWHSIEMVKIEHITTLGSMDIPASVLRVPATIGGVLMIVFIVLRWVYRLRVEKAIKGDDFSIDKESM